MKRHFTVLLMAVTILLSGAAGFGGTYLANNFRSLSSGTISVGQSISFDAIAEQPDERVAGLVDYFPGEFNTLGESDSASVAFLSNYSSGKTSDDVLTIPEIAALTSNSVVEIYTETVAGSGRLGQYITEGAGSGVIITSDGYIITNDHVINGARKITVRLRNGTEYDAALIGHDSKTDLAVLKINAAGLQAAVYGDSDKLLVGELAVAIGNPLGELGGSVTEGIISALGRSISIEGELMTLLQTTAAVNPGNSGGGLFNSYGELIGIVNAKSGGSDIEGIGFAIPVNTVEAVVDALIQYGYVPGRVDFGATLVDILDARTAMLYRLQSTGVYVSAADADNNLQSGDRIISIDGKEIKSTADVKAYLDTKKAGDTLSIAISRSGSSAVVNHTLKQLK